MNYWCDVIDLIFLLFRHSAFSIDRRILGVDKLVFFWKKKESKHGRMYLPSNLEGKQRERDKEPAKSKITENTDRKAINHIVEC